MAEVHAQAVAAVSASISTGEGDLLTKIHAAEKKWQAELDEAKATARTLLATVLSERETLRLSLGTAAELWRTLRPSCQRSSDRERLDHDMDHGRKTLFLADEQQLTCVKVLQNVSHTLFLTEFIISTPEYLKQARSSLQKIKEDGLDQVVSGNAAELVESHAILTASERLRDLLRLEAPEEFADDIALQQNFSNAIETRALLEDIVIHGVFSNIVEISQQNPRLLVAVARVIECEELEDDWWKTHHMRYYDAAVSGAAYCRDPKAYKQRATDAIVQSIQTNFRAREHQLELAEENGDRPVSGASNEKPSSEVNLQDILNWIERRRSEIETVRRFVVPCLPPSFCVSELFERELHREFMRLITLAVQMLNPDGSMLLSEADLIQLTSWYSTYKGEVGERQEDIDSFLEDEDRERLVSALQGHCASRISSKISSTLAADIDESFASHDLAEQTANEGARCSIAGLAIKRTDLPEIVLGCISEEVKRILSLNIRGLDHAIAQTAAKCLIAFQADVQRTLSPYSEPEQEESHRIHACTTANNMARCLDLSEHLKALFMSFTGDQDHPAIEDEMDDVIEGFRSTASIALHVLVNGINANIQHLASRFFAPHTGTEIMLDILATLDDFFGDYEVFLLDYHFEHLAIEALKRIVVWYMAPFLRLANHRVEESTARRFTSLPTFEEMNFRSARPGLYEDNLISTTSEHDDSEKFKGDGLISMNGAAVIAQVDKDISNLTTFMEKKVVSFQRKQMQTALEPFHAIRAMYTCPGTTFSLSETFREVHGVVGRALRPSWVMEYGLEGRFNVRVAEVIWGSRTDVNPVVRLEAVNTIRATAERLESTSQSRMSSFDDGRVWGSRTSDFGVGPSSEPFRKDAKSNDYGGSSSSLRWAPSLSRSSRPQSRRH